MDININFDMIWQGAYWGLFSGFVVLFAGFAISIIYKFINSFFRG